MSPQDGSCQKLDLWLLATSVKVMQKKTVASFFGTRCIYPSIFTARCTAVQSAVLRSHVVCLSFRPSVCLWRWWIRIT